MQVPQAGRKCGCAGIGRLASLRCWCPLDVRVQVPPSAPNRGEQYACLGFCYIHAKLERLNISLCACQEKKEDTVGKRWGIGDILGFLAFFHKKDEEEGCIREIFFSSKYLMIFKFSLPFPIKCFIIKVLNYTNWLVRFCVEGRDK